MNTAENPADPASRGLLPAATVSCKLHREGPSFLLSPEDQWPSRLFTPLQPEQLPDFQPSSSSVHTITFSTPPDELLRRFSSLTRMQRSLAYIQRFAFKARGQPLEKGPLRHDELDHTLMRAVRMIQDTYLSDLRKQLTNQSDHIKPTSIAQLAPFIDAYGLIRVGGRLRYASLDPDAKQPIVLPKISHLTSLIIQYYHQGFMHAGPKLVLAMIRRRFWILSGRDAVRKFIFSCITCVRYKANRPSPIMGNLPPSRVQQNRPFLHVGTDYGGPFLVKESHRHKAQTHKMYLALFVCMTTKAVHLEIVSNLSAEAFRASFDRFIARRGIPSDIFSDCGINYIGAARQIK